MSTYIVADITPKDTESLKKYSAAAGPLIEKYNGRFTSKGEIESLTGGEHSQIKVIIEFPNAETAKDWYNCNEYQELIPLRDKGMDCAFHLIKN